MPMKQLSPELKESILKVKSDVEIMMHSDESIDKLLWSLIRHGAWYPDEKYDCSDAI